MQSGTYIARAVDIDMGFAETGTPQYAVVFKIEDTGEHITWYGFMTEKTAERTLESLRYCGWRGMDPGAIEIEDLPEQVEIVVEEDEYNGNVRYRVRWVNQPGRRAVLKQRMDDKQRRSFGERFKGLAMKLKPIDASAPVVQAHVAKRGDNGARGQGPAIPEDDLPF